jgi:two-component system nitrate/nitrite response regulator NarL
MDDLRDAIAAAAIGGSYFTRASLSKLLKETSAPDQPQLTDREREVLVLLATGRTAPQIAGELDLAVSTVRSHLQKIYQKLGVSGQAAAAAVAVRLGLAT